MPPSLFTQALTHLTIYPPNIPTHWVHPLSNLAIRFTSNDYIINYYVHCNSNSNENSSRARVISASKSGMAEESSTSKYAKRSQWKSIQACSSLMNCTPLPAFQAWVQRGLLGINPISAGADAAHSFTRPSIFLFTFKRHLIH